MPKSKGQTHRFYDVDRNVYPFFARSEQQAIRYALEWSRRMGIKLYRARPKPTI